MAPADQQKLTVNAQSEPNTEDPQAVSYTYELTVNHQLFVALFDQDPKTSQVIPWGAVEVPTIEDLGPTGTLAVSINDLNEAHHDPHDNARIHRMEQDARQVMSAGIQFPCGAI